MKYFIIFIFGSIFLLFILPAGVFADSSCVSAYGATCPSGQLFIEKKVQNPKTGELVNVLSSSTATFAPEGEINFRIEVKNTGSANLSGTFVQDRLPGSIKFISSNPGSNFDQSNNILSWNIDNLGAGESRFFQVKFAVKAKADLNFDIACMTNFVQAQKDANVAQANALFCIQAQALKTMTPLKEIPKTGTREVIWVLAGLLVFLGFRLRNFSAGKIAFDKTIQKSAHYIFEFRKILKEKGGGK